ncbi:MAG: hypothetical protein M0Q92_02995 [Methanoregula sp.]|jgi:hypothetical protein|nr:hypothetical protein [Methanoregula sp.]
MESWIISIVSLILGAVVGFVFTFLIEWWKQKNLIKGYCTILESELKNLKEDNPGGLDEVIKNYYSDFIGGGKPVPSEADAKHSNEFLRKWSFWHKYAFLRNNLDKLYLLKPETVKSLLKIYSRMEEFEQFSTRDPPMLLIQNLEHAQKEIPITLALLGGEL